VNEKKLAQYSRAYQLIERHYLQRQKTPFSLKQTAQAISDLLEYQFLPHYAAAPPFWRVWLRSFKPRTLPDFAVVGPIKSGSSDLVTHLLLHPCIIPPLAKEIYSMEPELWRPYYPTMNERKRVEALHGKAISGYLGPFMHSTQFIERYGVACPSAKIIILLRDPVERAYSHWKWELLLGGTLAQNLSFYKDFATCVNTAIELFPENEIDSFCGFPILESGIYFKSIMQWMKAFGPEQVMVLDMASYYRSRAEILDQIQTFLEIPKAEIAGTGRPLNRNPLQKEGMDESSRRALKEFYQPYNEKLYALIGARYGW